MLPFLLSLLVLASFFASLTISTPLMLSPYASKLSFSAAPNTTIDQHNTNPHNNTLNSSETVPLNRSEARCTTTIPANSLLINLQIPNPINTNLKGFYNPGTNYICIEVSTINKPLPLLLLFEDHEFDLRAYELRHVVEETERYAGTLTFFLETQEAPEEKLDRVVVVTASGNFANSIVLRTVELARMPEPLNGPGREWRPPHNVTETVGNENPAAA